MSMIPRVRLDSRRDSGSEPQVRLSVVIPAFNEERRLATSLRVLREAWEWGPEAELIVVDDGSTDDTVRVARAGLADVDGAHLLRQRHQGKGAAVRRGMLAARGERIAFMDADLATDVADLPLLVGGLDHADIVVGSRLLAQAVVTGRTFHRGVLHHAFRWQVRRWGGVAVSDPQCGFKAFRRDAARTLFSRCAAKGFGFDVEVLLLARHLGLRIAEIPVRWHDVEGSRVRLVRDSTEMFADLLRVRGRVAEAVRAQS